MCMCMYVYTYRYRYVGVTGLTRSLHCMAVVNISTKESVFVSTSW